MDLFNEYNRLRKNILQKGRYYGIQLSIPTARELSTPITESTISQLKSIDIHSRLSTLPSASIKRYKSTYYKKSSKAPKPSKRTRVASIDEPLVPKRKEKEIPKSNISPLAPSSNFPPESNDEERLTVEEIYKEYGTNFLRYQDGQWYDIKTGEALGISDPSVSPSFLGELIAHRHPDFREVINKDTSVNSDLDLADELQYFKDYVEDRLREAVANRKEESDEGIELVQRLIDNLSIEDIKGAKERFDFLKDEIKNYLDVTIYYADEMTHDRALDTIDYLFDFSQSLDEVRQRIADTWEDIE